MNRSLCSLVLLVAAAALADDLAPAEFKAQVEAQQGLLLDVRTPLEVARGKLAGGSVLDFQTPWCTPCQQMVPVFGFYVGGKERARRSGVQPRQALEAMLEK